MRRTSTSKWDSKNIPDVWLGLGGQVECESCVPAFRPKTCVPFYILCLLSYSRSPSMQDCGSEMLRILFCFSLYTQSCSSATLRSSFSHSIQNYVFFFLFAWFCLFFLSASKNISLDLCAVFSVQSPSLRTIRALLF